MVVTGGVAEFNTGLLFYMSLAASCALYAVVLYDLDDFFLSSQKNLQAVWLIRACGLFGWLVVPAAWFLANLGLIGFNLEHLLYFLGDILTKSLVSFLVILRFGMIARQKELLRCAEEQTQRTLYADHTSNLNYP